MTRGHNELVGLRVTLSRVIPRYRTEHHYRWRANGQTKKTGSMRGYDLRRSVPAATLLHSFRDAYASAILSIFRKVTRGCVEEYYQFAVGATPEAMGFPGNWEHWAEM